MNNNDILRQLKDLIDQGAVNKEQILNLLNEQGKKTEQKHSFTFQQLFYFIGGLIVVLGFVIFISRFWMEWTEFTKVIFALGLSITFYIVGYYLYYTYSELMVFSSVSFILSAFLLPLGIKTFFDLINFSLSEYGPISFYLFILFVIYFSSFWLLKNDIFLLFSTASVSGLFLSMIGLLAAEPSKNLTLYCFMILGLAYFAFAEYLKFYRQNLVNIFHLFGAFFFLASTFALSFDSFFWLFAFPFILAVSFYVSIFLENKRLLFFSTIFTFIEIGRITTEFFSDSLGWPISLIFAGFSIMFIGYLSYVLNKKYIQKNI